MNKVAIFRVRLLPYSETFIREQALALRRWHPIMIGCERIPDGLSLDALEVRILPSPGAAFLARLAGSFRKRFALPYPPRVTALRKSGCRLVHAHFGLDAVEIWPAARNARLPMLVTLHGYDVCTHREWWEAGKGGDRFRDYPRRLLAMARDSRVRFIAVSNAIRDQAIAFGIPKEKVQVRHVGVNTRRFRPGGPPICQRPKRVLFVGRLVENKGVEYLVRAFAELRALVPEAQLVIAGDGPLRETLRRLADDLHVQAQFLGAIPNEDVKLQLDHTRVLCLPSVTVASGASEGFGMVILEAQASGVPVVTSSKGGKNDGLKDLVTGFAFAERDTAALTRHLATLLTNNDSLRRMSAEAVEFVRRKFDLHVCTERVEELYDTHSL